MDYKYTIDYSLDNGEIQNTVGCHTEQQAIEIGQHIHYGYKQCMMKIDHLWIIDENQKRIIEFDEEGNDYPTE